MIRIENLIVVQEQFALRNVFLEIPQGRYGVLMGPTGCGKTTTLEAICGLRPLQSGRITLGDRDVTALRPAERDIGYVPQDGVLFSTMTVRQNLAFALSVRKINSHVANDRIEELAPHVGGFLLTQVEYEGGMSGWNEALVAEAVGVAGSVRITAATLCEGWVTVDSQRPVELVIPMIKKKLGFD